MTDNVKKPTHIPTDANAVDHLGRPAPKPVILERHPEKPGLPTDFTKAKKVIAHTHGTIEVDW